MVDMTGALSVDILFAFLRTWGWQKGLHDLVLANDTNKDWGKVQLRFSRSPLPSVWWFWKRMAWPGAGRHTQPAQITEWPPDLDLPWRVWGLRVNLEETKNNTMLLWYLACFATTASQLVLSWLMFYYLPASASSKFHLNVCSFYRWPMHSTGVVL